MLLSQCIDAGDLTPDARLVEIATILARGVLRLKAATPPQNSPDSAADPLEFSGDSRLSITTG